MNEQLKPEEWLMKLQSDTVVDLSEDLRWAKIVDEPAYEIDDNKSTKLHLKVRLSDGRVMSYYPNRTSANTIANKLGTDLSTDAMKGWVDKTIIWGSIVEMLIAGNKKKVLYVTDAK